MEPLKKSQKKLEKFGSTEPNLGHSGTHRTVRCVCRLRRTAENAVLRNFNYKIHWTMNSALFGAPDMDSNGSLPAGASRQRLADVAAVWWCTGLSGATPEKETTQSDRRATISNQDTSGAPDSPVSL
jgi:hypothetical protein